MNRLHCVIDTTPIGFCNVDITDESGEKVCSVKNVWLENALHAIKEAANKEKRQNHGNPAIRTEIVQR